MFALSKLYFCFWEKVIFIFVNILKEDYEKRVDKPFKQINKEKINVNMFALSNFLFYFWEDNPVST